jgi:hypothetical protein
MDTLTVFAMGEANRGNKMKVFDWNKAAQIIKDRHASHASAGLSGDWEYTGGSILEDGKPVDKDETYVYLASTWATPELEIDYDTVDCFVMEDDVPPAWTDGGDDFASVYWPKSALDILEKA